ncbi:MAG: Gfo/Idh/MocA family oxidoreductase [Candidatus Anammoximicrobium sp.]|mgnify:CR=1 FL=1|nr:Gfo/Idh/MocA family oxidoreductase [Candidatus Anammoximicrobium sp.]
MNTSRRSFLKQAAASAAGVPFLLPSRIWAAEPQPNARITMGFIGMGKQNRGLLGGFLGQQTKVLAVCDVDTTRREAAKKRVDEYYAQKGEQGSQCAAYNDFREIIERKDIDAVCIATPDHWHAIITVAALRAGKDVYCEKPLTHNIHEAVEVIRAVDATGRILQTGSMQRSSKEFRVACELVQNGAIGKVERVECSFGDPGVPCNLGEEPLEPGLDWNLWLGPTPLRPYHSVLSPRGNHDHYPNWRAYREYGGGMVTDWGAHHLDIAQWGLGMDASGPVEVLPPETPEAKRGAKLVYANGVTVEHKNGFGAHFYGTEGEIQVNRGKFTFQRGSEVIASFTGSEEERKKTSCAAQVQIAERDFLKDAKIRLYDSKNQLWDFLECVQSRKKPICNEQVGGRSAICCHLMNQAYYHGQKLKWDPAKFVFVDGAGDPAWLTRDYRSPWSV